MTGSAWWRGLAWVLVAATFASSPWAPAGAAAADFSVALVPAASKVEAGSSASTKVETTALGLSGDLTLSVAKLPPGARASFAAESIPVGASTMLDLVFTYATPPGKYHVAVTATQVLDPQAGTPISHTVDWLLTVKKAPPDPNLNRALKPIKQLIKGKWKQPLPAACPAVPDCLISYTNLPLPRRLQHVVASQQQPLALPTLSMEALRIVPAQPLRCAPDGSVSLAGLTGTAAGPYPGTVTFGSAAENKISPAVLPFLPRSFFFSYVISGAGFTQGTPGFVSGTILTLGCDAEGQFLGGLGGAHYDALMNDPPASISDGGDLLIVFPAPRSRSRSIDASFTSRSGGLGSLPAPTPICPPLC